MAISPPRLPAVTAHDFPTLEIETCWLKVRRRPHSPAKNIRFPSTGGTRAGAPKLLQRQIRLLAIRPSNGELGSNLLNRLRLEHTNGRLGNYGAKPKELQGLASSAQPYPQALGAIASPNFRFFVAGT